MWLKFQKVTSLSQERREHNMFYTKNVKIISQAREKWYQMEAWIFRKEKEHWKDTSVSRYTKFHIIFIFIHLIFNFFDWLLTVQSKSNIILWSFRICRSKTYENNSKMCRRRENRILLLKILIYFIK